MSFPWNRVYVSTGHGFYAAGELVDAVANDHMTVPIVKGLLRDADVCLAYPEFPRAVDPE
jgi:hypothetical protein